LTYAVHGVHRINLLHVFLNNASAQIEATDRQIDRLVYELYGLTAEEIAIVEDAAG